MFETSTLLTADFLKNEMGYTMPGDASFQKAKFKAYYVSTCAYIREHHYLKLTPANIEAYLSAGEFIYDEFNTITCSISTADEREYYFKLAMAKQLIYDFTGGRGAMLRGADNRFNVCADFVDPIKMLGLYQRSPDVI
jgi:hypothetical protein